MWHRDHGLGISPLQNSSPAAVCLRHGLCLLSDTHLTLDTQGRTRQKMPL
jgi:hypothetical protein